MPNLYLKNPTEIANLTKEDASTILKPLNLPVQKEGNTIKDDIDLKLNKMSLIIDSCFNTIKDDIDLKLGF